MPNYRRAFVPGGCWFFTVNLLERRRRLLVEEIDALRDATLRTKARLPFRADAFVVLPDHMHAVWTLPPGDADFATRWRLIKTRFSRAIPKGERLSAVRERAAAFGRVLDYGLRVHLIVRETDEAAWNAAERLISRLSDTTIAAAKQQFLSESDSVGQRRQFELHGGRRDKLEVSPNLWAGIGLVRHGVGTALVGSPRTVAARLGEYQALGIRTVIASGYPHLEEAYRVAELLFPELGIDRQTNERGRDFVAAAPRIAAE